MAVISIVIFWSELSQIWTYFGSMEYVEKGVHPGWVMDSVGHGATIRHAAKINIVLLHIRQQVQYGYLVDYKGVFVYIDNPVGIHPKNIPQVAKTI